jgi:hypothetical protein
MGIAMTTEAWHVDEELWTRYAEGRLDPVTESAVDAHVMRCDRCRAGARTQVEPTELDGLWSEVSLGVVRPEVARPLRWVRRVGVPESDAVIVGASDGLYLPWAVAVGSALTCALLAAFVPRYQDVSFLLLAPLIPVLAVVAAYDATDPLRELIAGTPFSKLRIALMRTTAALTVALPVTLAVGLVVPGLEDLALVWLLPGLFLTVTALVGMTWLRPWSAGTVVCSAWTVFVVVAAGPRDVDVLATAPAQIAFAMISLGMATAFLARISTRLLRGAA